MPRGKRTAGALDRAEDRRAEQWRDVIDDAVADAVLKVADVRRLRMLPGDALIVTVPAEVPLDRIDYTTKRLRDELPDRKILVVVGPAEYTVLPPAPGDVAVGRMRAQHYPDGTVVIRPDRGAESAES